MLRINDVHIVYHDTEGPVEAVSGISLDLNDQDYVALVGPSGSGKSTLVAAIGGLIFPKSGDIFLDKHRINRLGRRRRARLRAGYFGIVFQFSELIPRFTVAENLTLAWQARYGYQERQRYKKRLEYLADKLEMQSLLTAYPAKLSGGQLQKTAIARAFITDPPILLADEPSGDLDPDNIELVRQLFSEENARGKSILLVTHDMNLAFDAKTIFALEDGEISEVVK